MKNYDIIAIGSGSSMNIVPAYLDRDPKFRAAVIDKDDPGGICLTRGCIPTKMLVYPAELLRLIQEAEKFGIDASIKKIDFQKVMGRMRSHIKPQIEGIRKGLGHSDNIDYYPVAAEFIAPYTLKVGKETIKSKFILLCLGSEIAIPPVKGLDKIKYHTSNTILEINKLPDTIVIIGGGYVAAEYGHFFSAMGSKVTIVGRNPQFLPGEETEISRFAIEQMSGHMKIVTNHEIIEAQSGMLGKKTLIAKDRKSGKTVSFTADEVLVATGRVPNTAMLHPEKSGIELDAKGWVKTNEYMETTQPGIWAFGDANGKHLFKHVANEESIVTYYNAVLGKKMPMDYHAVPHAVFTYPEIAGVGMTQAEAVKVHGETGVLIGFHKYEDTAKGTAMDADGFVKVIVSASDKKILGAHIVGPQASVLIQEIINLMYTPSGSILPLTKAMHIHPALSEVVERACGRFMSVAQYEHFQMHERGEAHVEPAHHH
ncbi:MAG: dihydrolipoyl dehydrogenase [Candidatus Thermoplasmatota archaeon]|nr:dihydrolipoyl dehydrogenase [Euryarchaeota archaeon]MBU4032552.1 dihydrolipoyl dehydrogenase [Candidatus Thermoplasmatota archaeon]MBU4072025.1 dihydrolipoyl dehydrogenase [Candidatus Thermoplasmatota archaeon]MBU4144556.1 dihydrolipoyl dehydrogenase [Candidatus Thermoplasmatota archaeon]MBU4592105.1 dihydrolipoyl dehydrogenase [Candidatus Thermoplasmatota archaeon]